MCGREEKVEIRNGAKACLFRSSQYVQSYVNNAEVYLEGKGMSFPAKAEIPITNSYCLEIDVSLELGSNDAAHYQSLIGIIRWMVEVVRVDICLECSMMSSHLDFPR